MPNLRNAQPLFSVGSEQIPCDEARAGEKQLDGLLEGVEPGQRVTHDPPSQSFPSFSAQQDRTLCSRMNCLKVLTMDLIAPSIRGAVSETLPVILDFPLAARRSLASGRLREALLTRVNSLKNLKGGLDRALDARGWLPELR